MREFAGRSLLFAYVIATIGLMTFWWLLLMRKEGDKEMKWREDRVFASKFTPKDFELKNRILFLFLTTWCITECCWLQVLLWEESKSFVTSLDNDKNFAQVIFRSFHYLNWLSSPCRIARTFSENLDNEFFWFYYFRLRELWLFAFDWRRGKLKETSVFESSLR